MGEAHEGCVFVSALTCQHSLIMTSVTILCNSGILTLRTSEIVFLIGIGMKLLNKFGFTGRLGAKENGVSRAIEVVVRPNGQGLGFGDFTESSALVVNKKLVAEWSGVEYVEDEATLEAKRAKKIVTEQIADSKSWKKNRKEKQQVKSVKVSDYLDGKAADANSKVVIIDMRGEQTRVLTDYSEMNVVSADEENEAPKLGQELLYNINLVVDLLEIDVTQQSKKLSQETQKVNIITSDITLLESQSGNDLPRLKRLENVMKILDKVAEKQKKELNKKNAEDLLKRDTDDNDMDVECTVIEPEYEITLSAISTLFQTLHKNYTEEFHIFGLIQLLPSLLSPVLQRMFSTWQPLLEPDKMAEIHTAGSALGDYFESIGEHTLRAQTR
jgi:tuftelin-interacting protein 11